MKTISRFSALSWFLSGMFLLGSQCAVAADKPATKTLKEAFLAALNRSDAISVQKELLIQANELEKQAMGAILPTVTGNASILKQESPTNLTGSSISPGTQRMVRVTGVQPLFQGLRDFAALRQRKGIVGAQGSALQNAARLLFYDLSNAYYNVLIFQADVRNYHVQIEVNQQRLKELKDFYKIGRSQLTDVLTFESNIANLESQLEFSKGQLEIAKDILAYVTGWNRETVLKDDESFAKTPNDINWYLEKIEERPDVHMAAANAKAYEEGIGIAWGQHLPSVNLLGNYYFERPGSAFSGINWDVQLAMSLPIFSGGIIQAQVRQAESVARQYSLQLSQTRRLAEQEIRTLHDQLRSDQKQLEKLSKLVSVAGRNSDEQIKLYRNGLVTNLEVLTGITTFQEAHRRKDRQYFAVQLDHAQLQAATGQRAEISVKTDTNP